VERISDSAGQISEGGLLKGRNRAELSLKLRLEKTEEGERKGVLGDDSQAGVQSNPWFNSTPGIKKEEIYTAETTKIELKSWEETEKGKNVD